MSNAPKEVGEAVAVDAAHAMLDQGQLVHNPVVITKMARPFGCGRGLAAVTPEEAGQGLAVLVDPDGLGG